MKPKFIKEDLNKLTEELTPKIQEILKKIDPKSTQHASDVLCFSLVVNTSNTLAEAIGRFETMKKRVYDLMDSDEFQDFVKMMKERPEKDINYIG